MKIKGHTLQREYLAKSFATGKLANSYLFHGIDGIGKKLVATEFASILNCTDIYRTDPLGFDNVCNCISCTKISKGIHPDVSVILSGGFKEIKVDQIREQIEDLLYLKPYEGTFKVALVDNAHLMNVNAQNAFLKTLEEPPLNSVIILITSKPNYLLPTIISRCQGIEFFPLPGDVIRDFIKTTDVPEIEMENIVMLSRGSIGKSRIFDMESLEQRKALIDKFSSFNTHNAVEICEFVEHFTRDKSPDNANRINFIFEMLFMWIKDILSIKYGIEKQYLLHRDLYDTSREMASRWSFDDISARWKLLEEGWEALFKRNVNRQYVLENLAIGFSRISNLKGSQ